MERIRPNNIVKHIPTGKEWVVCGVYYMKGDLIPCGYPFTSIAKISDCELIKSEYLTKPQSKEQIEALKNENLERFIDVTSAMFHGVI